MVRAVGTPPDPVSGTVVGIDGLAHAMPPGEPVPEVVELLKEWLAEAEAGALRQVLLAGVKSNGMTRTEYAGRANVDQCVSAVTLLQARVLAAAL